MKVKVTVKHAPLNQVEYFLNQALAETQSDLAAAYEQIEKLIQENKDLRVSEGHLRDEMKILERNQKVADAAVTAWQNRYDEAVRDRRKAEYEKQKAEEDFATMKRHYADARAEADNLQAAYQQLQSAMCKVVRDLNTVQTQDSEELCDLRERLHDREARIDELEQRIEWLQNERSLYEQNVKKLNEKIFILEQAVSAHEDEKAAFEQAVSDFDAARQDYEGEIVRLCKEKQEWIDRHEQMQQERNKAWKEIKLLAGADAECKDLQRNNQKLKNAIAALEKQLKESKNVDTIPQVQIKPAPKVYTNLWNLLQENGLIVDTKEGPHNG